MGARCLAQLIRSGYNIITIHGGGSAQSDGLTRRGGALVLRRMRAVVRPSSGAPAGHYKMFNVCFAPARSIERSRVCNNMQAEWRTGTGCPRNPGRGGRGSLLRVLPCVTGAQTERTRRVCSGHGQDASADKQLRMVPCDYRIHPDVTPTGCGRPGLLPSCISLKVSNIALLKPSGRFLVTSPTTKN